MQLSRMQDIGGCRAILSNVDQVIALVDAYVGGIKKNPSQTTLVKSHDYINHPKPDGYRGYHLVFKFQSTSTQRDIYNGFCVEIQLRSRLQHAWATAVETVSTFTGQTLKSNIGEDSWKRFFALMGTAIARREDTPLVGGTPSTKKLLRDELVSLCDSLEVESVLEGWREALRVSEPDVLPEEFQDGQALLILDTKQKQMEIRTFARDNVYGASELYLYFERKARHDPSIQVVLVSVDSLSALKSAYPNYYLDATAFLQAVQEAVQ